MSIVAETTPETVDATVESTLVDDVASLSVQEQSAAGETKKRNRSKKAKGPTIMARAVGKPPAGHTTGCKEGVTLSSPLALPVSAFYDGVYPEGQIQEYEQDFNTYRITSAEKKEAEKMHESEWNEVREAAEAHRLVRQDLQKFIRPGQSLMEIARRIEQGTWTTLGSKGNGDLERGRGFPTGLSLNHIAAHFSPNVGDTNILRQDDVLKVDFGTQINGRIIDSAFTVHFNPVYDQLVEAVKDATMTGIKVAGIDMRLGDIGGAIQEVMESYECELDGKIYPVRCLRNLNGHNIDKYRIHGGKSVPIVNNGDQTKMDEGEFFAIETFGSINGRGVVYEDGENSHLAISRNFKGKIRGGERVVKLYSAIQKNFSTLAFAKRWLDEMGESNYNLALKQLIDQGAIEEYPPLVESKNAYTAQFEHTILLRPTCKEVLSHGYDY